LRFPPVGAIRGSAIFSRVRCPDVLGGAAPSSTLPAIRAFPFYYCFESAFIIGDHLSPSNCFFYPILCYSSFDLSSLPSVSVEHKSGEKIFSFVILLVSRHHTFSNGLFDPPTAPPTQAQITRSIPCSLCLTSWIGFLFPLVEIFCGQSLAIPFAIPLLSSRLGLVNPRVATPSTILVKLNIPAPHQLFISLSRIC